MKDIFVNGRFLCRKPTGVDRYALEVLKGIDQLIAEGEPSVQGQRWTILTPRQTLHHHPDFKHLSIKQIGPLKGNAWEQITLPWASRGQTLLNLCNAAPIVKHRQLVVIHDATPVRVPEAYSKNFARWYRFMVPQLLARSETIATVSQFSRKEIASAYRTNRQIHVVREGADHFQQLTADDRVITKHGLNTRPYILAVGSMAPHKNFGLLIKAVEAIDNPPFDCVIAGGVNPIIFASKPTDFPKWVKHVGYVSDQELKSLYQNALCFVFPSLYEGYGLPPTEAMAEGCPVVSSNAASMPEICGNAVVYFDPRNALQLSETLLSITQDTSKLAEMSIAGSKQADNLRWHTGALDITRLLKQK